MNLSKQLLFIGCLSVVALTAAASDVNSSCAKGEWVVYKPVELNRSAENTDDLYLIYSGPVSKKEIANAAFVLDSYMFWMKDTQQLEYKLAGSQLFIRCELWQDKQLLSSVTGKSRDENWIASERVLLKKLDELKQRKQQRTLGTRPDSKADQPR